MNVGFEKAAMPQMRKSPKPKPASPRAHAMLASLRSSPFSSIQLKKSRSQVFLSDASVLEGEAEALDVRDETVLEIGAGDGRLSEKLLARGPSSLTLVELDQKWADYLKEKFEKDARVSVLQADFLSLSDEFPASRVIGNIPYQITSPILLKLGRMKFGRAVLCIQKEVAARMMAKAGSSEYGRLSIYAQLHFGIQLLAEVPRASFTPPPKVDSSVVLLQPLGSARSLPPHLDLVTAALFSHRLQTLGQALVHARRLWGWDKDGARQWGRKLKMDGTRVFQLKPAELAAIARLLPPPAVSHGGRNTQSVPSSTRPAAKAGQQSRHVG